MIAKGNILTQVIYGQTFKRLCCLKCNHPIADGIMDGVVKGKPEGRHPVRILCRNCKTENFICH